MKCATASIGRYLLQQQSNAEIEMKIDVITGLLLDFAAQKPTWSNTYKKNDRIIMDIYCCGRDDPSLSMEI